MKTHPCLFLFKTNFKEYKNPNSLRIKEGAFITAAVNLTDVFVFNLQIENHISDIDNWERSVFNPFLKGNHSYWHERNCHFLLWMDFSSEGITNDPNPFSAPNNLVVNHQQQLKRSVYIPLLGRMRNAAHPFFLMACHSLRLQALGKASLPLSLMMSERPLRYNSISSLLSIRRHLNPLIFFVWTNSFQI